MSIVLDKVFSFRHNTQFWDKKVGKVCLFCLLTFFVGCGIMEISANALERGRLILDTCQTFPRSARPIKKHRRTFAPRHFRHSSKRS